MASCCVMPFCTFAEHRYAKKVRFPSITGRGHRFIQWLILCQRVDLIDADPEYVYKNKRICARHFSDSCYRIGPNFKRLRDDAVPDTNLPGPSLQDPFSILPFHLPTHLDELSGPSGSTGSASMALKDALNRSENTSLQEDIRTEESMAELSSSVSNTFHITGDSDSTSGLTLSVLDPMEIVKTVTVVPVNSRKSVKPLQSRNAIGDNQNISHETVNRTGFTVLDHNSRLINNSRPIVDKSTIPEKDNAPKTPSRNSISARVNITPKVPRKNTQSLKKVVSPNQNCTDQISFVETRLNETLQTPDANPPSSDNENVYLHGITTDHDLISQHKVKVFGKNISNPSVLTSILSQANLTKKGSVYVLPVSGKVETGKLTNSQLEKIIKQNTSGIVKNKLLKAMGLKYTSVKRCGIRDRRNKIISGQLSVKKKFSKIKSSGCSSPKKRKPNRTGLKRTCKCTIHCRKTVVSAGVSANIDGSLLNSDSDIFDPNNLDNMFTLSTILTNVNDKYQMEQLCQLVIECIYRLKNINIYGTMGTLTIYLTHNAVNKPGEPPEPPSEGQSQQVHANSTAHVNEGTPEELECAVAAENISEFANTSNLRVSSNGENLPEEHSNSHTNEQADNTHSCSLDLRSTPHFGEYSRLKHKNVKLSLSAFHDHNYLSLQSKILFEKPDYLVNLINLDKYISKKKSRVLTEDVALNKKLISTQRYKKKLCKVEESVKKKANFIKVLQNRIRVLKNMIIQEKGIKKFKYPKIEQNDLNMSQERSTSNESNPWDGFGEIDAQADSEITVKPKKRKRRRKEVHDPSAIDAVDENCRTPLKLGPKVLKEKNSYKSRKKNRAQGGNNLKYIQGFGYVSPNKKKVPKKDITPNYDISAIVNSHDTPEYLSVSPQNSDLINSYKALFESLIEEEVIY